MNRAADGLTAWGEDWRTDIVPPQLRYLIIFHFPLIRMKHRSDFAQAFRREKGLNDAFPHLKAPEISDLQARTAVRAQEDLHRLLPGRQDLFMY